METIFAKIAVMIAAILGMEENLNLMSNDLKTNSELIQQSKVANNDRENADGGLRLGEKFSSR